MRVITYREAIREAMREEMLRDKTVFLLGEDIGLYGGAYAVTKGLLDEFGSERVRDTPMSEAIIVGAATGAAAAGTRPVAEIMYIDFMTFAMDQIVNQAAKMRYMFGGRMEVPMVVRTQGGTGRSSAAQHSQSLESWFIHVPGLRVVLPSSPYDAKGLLKTAIRTNDPVLFIEHKLLYTTKGEVPEEEYTIPFGVADIRHPGKDLTIVAYSRMVLFALEAANELEQVGISAEVIDLRTLNPLDMNTILVSVKKTNRVIIVEEDCKTGGTGAEISAQIVEKSFDYLDVPICRLAGKDTPIPCSPVLERAAIPNKGDIIEAARRLVSS